MFFITNQIKIFILSIISVVVLDQSSKLLAELLISPAKHIFIFPGFFDLVLWKNSGVAFGLFSELRGGRWLWIGLTIVFLFWGYWLLSYSDKITKINSLFLGLIFGGALGNLIDRLRIGQVIDFILVYYHNWHWPAFNLADFAISIGAGGLAIVLIRGTN